MNNKKIAVITLLVVVIVAFFFGVQAYQRNTQAEQRQAATQNADRLVRMHSPVLGPQNAPVTIVEFFDPACETCRAFYPVVKQLMAKYPTDLRLVMRYAPFHQGSDQVIKLLEASKAQNRYWQVLESVLAAQPAWADHGSPNIDLAYKAAELGGLDLQKALADAATPAIDAVLRQDVEDLTALGVNKTPTFFVNGRPLPSFGEDQLTALIEEEVAKAQK